MNMNSLTLTYFKPPIPCFANFSGIIDKSKPAK